MIHQNKVESTNVDRDCSRILGMNGCKRKCVCEYEFSVSTAFTHTQILIEDLSETIPKKRGPRLSVTAYNICRNKVLYRTYSLLCTILMIM